MLCDMKLFHLIMDEVEARGIAVRKKLYMTRNIKLYTLKAYIQTKVLITNYPHLPSLSLCYTHLCFLKAL